MSHVPPLERRSDEEIREAVRKAFTHNWARTALGFRLDELEIASEEHARLCAADYETMQRARDVALRLQRR